MTTVTLHRVAVAIVIWIGLALLLIAPVVQRRRVPKKVPPHDPRQIPRTDGTMGEVGRALLHHQPDRGAP